MTALVRAAGLEGYASLAGERGLDAARELRRVGLSLRALREPDGLIPVLAVIGLLEHSAAAAAEAGFGLLLAQRQGMAVLGPIEVLLRHAATLGEALSLASTYLFVHSPALRFDLLAVPGRDGEVDLVFSIDLPRLPPARQTVELSLGFVVRVVKLLSAGRSRPLVVLFPHARGAPPARYAEAFGCECRFGAERAAVRIRGADLRQPMAAHDPRVREMAQAYLAQRFGGPERRFAAEVALLVRRMLGVQRPTRERVAEALAVHPVTLQRRLAAEGTCFEDLLDDIRKDRLAELAKQHQELSLTQIALILGYSEQSALTRACRRWFGQSPSALRRR